MFGSQFKIDTSITVPGFDMAIPVTVSVNIAAKAKRAEDVGAANHITDIEYRAWARTPHGNFAGRAEGETIEGVIAEALEAMMHDKRKEVSDG